jgi:release factor glutamine methyltransferase
MKFEKSIRQALQGCGLPRLEARMLMEHVLKKDRAWFIAHDDEHMLHDHAATFDALVEQRLAGLPMAYLLGEREFLGRMFGINPTVLIPRPETELLVETGLSCLHDQKAASVLDLGTGSGIIAISIAAARPLWQVVATDISQGALDMARRNAARHKVNIEFFLGSWYQAFPSQLQFDLILSNPPYIREGDQHLDQGDLRYEPRGALTDGADGLSAIREIVQGALIHLKEGGRLWVEHGYDQADQVRSIFNQHGFRDIESKMDLSGIIRVTGGRLLTQ